ERVDACGVPAVWVTTADADDEKAVLYLHGGGYVSGSITTHQSLAASVSRDAGVKVLLIDYRLGPEDPYPAAVDDAVAAYGFLLEGGSGGGADRRRRSTGSSSAVAPPDRGGPPDQKGFA